MPFYSGGFLGYQSRPPHKTKSWEEKMILSNGATYCLGQWIKDRGERIGHIRVFGIHIFNWIAGAVISLGLAIKDSVRHSPLMEM
jgi:hypothetical protein